MPNDDMFQFNDESSVNHYFYLLLNRLTLLILLLSHIQLHTYIIYEPVSGIEVFLGNNKTQN